MEHLGSKASGETHLAHSPEEAARLAGCGRTFIFAEIRSGRLRARKLGRLTKILHADLCAWLESLPARAA
jgi:excisionase family DNA binding protein